MDCEICGNLFSERRKCLCVTCARSAVYPLRLEQVNMLLEKESMARRVEAVMGGMGKDSPRETMALSGVMIDTFECAKAHEMEYTNSDATAITERLNQITEKAQQLRLDIEAYKKTIAEKKKALAQRRSDYNSAIFGLEGRNTRELEEIQSGIRRINRRRDQKLLEIVTGRYQLCKEAAIFAGLKRVKKKREDGAIREYYKIGNTLPIFDLRELHTAKPHELSASLTQIACLTARAATYLGLRLPAEITVPHKSYPLATIFSPNSSYTFRDVVFPSLTPSQSARSLSASQSQDQRPLPHPRTLFINTTLAKLMKDDPPASSIFIEGVTLLAWDIAWLCKVQGMSGFNSEEDICPLGRNLWNLLIGEVKSSITTKGESRGDVAITPAKAAVETSAPLLFGQYSHSTTVGFFGAADGKDLLRNWKLSSPARSVDKIKDHLKSEIQKAEWELLDEKEWDGLGADEEEPVMVHDGKSKPARNENTGSTAKAVESVRKEAPRRPSIRNGSESGKSTPARTGGANGWTNVRSRNSEAGRTAKE